MCIGIQDSEDHTKHFRFFLVFLKTSIAYFRTAVAYLPS